MHTTSSRDEARAAAERVLGDGSVVIDLNHPPSREDLGVTSEKGTVHVMQRSDLKPFRATIKFTDGRQIMTESRPDLQWAGMARMIGPSFAAGFHDLHMLGRLGDALDEIPVPLKAAILPPGVVVADLSSQDLRFYEAKFLSMQKEIFHDMGSMHQAYVDGGLPAIREMEQAGLFKRDPQIADAWADLDSGDPQRVSAANGLFLKREQYDIIRDDYQDMYNHRPSGPFVTWGMTQIGVPSIVDSHGHAAQGFAEYFPLTIPLETPGPTHLPFTGLDNPFQGSVTVETPFAGANVADFDDRWQLIKEDTFPTYQDLIVNNPTLAQQIIGGDIDAQIEQCRLEHTIDNTMWHMTHWKVVDVEQ